MKKKIKSDLGIMKKNRKSMQASYDDLMRFKGNWQEKRKRKMDLMMISACIEYAELLLKPTVTK